MAYTSKFFEHVISINAFPDTKEMIGALRVRNLALQIR